jgi:chemotaxis protein methyltransferase CheR
MLNGTDFDYLCTLIRQRSGIVLDTEKDYLVESRLLPVARNEGLASLPELVTRLRMQSAKELQRKVVEALTTNETSFYRDLHPFEALKTHLLPELQRQLAAGQKLHIWCAACSSGQEPYSIAILIREHFPALASKVKIVATDLSTDILNRAKKGAYNQFEVNRGLPAMLLMKYFERQGLEWQVKPDIRNMVEFRLLNLLEHWSVLPAVDIIFLRNVLIYFDVETKKALLGKVRRQLRPGGYLFLGAAETVINLDNAFKTVSIDKARCYRLADC